MLIGGFQKFSLSDFPGRSAALIFTQGCNFMCPWCHNKSLLPRLPLNGTLYSEDIILRFMACRAGMLDAVVITGGEPTLHADLPEFAGRIKSLGYAIKLDTNGSAPRMLSRLIASGLVDYIAMDIKAPIDRYAALAGVEPPAGAISESISLIAESGMEHEFRTTFVDHLLSESDMDGIMSLVPPGSRHRIQEYRSVTADPRSAIGPRSVPSPSPPAGSRGLAAADLANPA